MEKTIWKYKIAITDRQIIEMPQETKILSVQIQDNHVCLWCLIAPERTTFPRGIRIIGTGEPIEPGFDGIFIDTIQLNKDLEFHVFDEGFI